MEKIIASASWGGGPLTRIEQLEASLAELNTQITELKAQVIEQNSAITAVDNANNIRSIMKSKTAYQVNVGCDIGGTTRIIVDVHGQAYNSISGIIFTRYSTYAVSSGVDQSGVATNVLLNPLTSSSSGLSAAIESGNIVFTLDSWESFNIIFCTHGYSIPNFIIEQ